LRVGAATVKTGNAVKFVDKKCNTKDRGQTGVWSFNKNNQVSNYKFFLGYNTIDRKSLKRSCSPRIQEGAGKLRIILIY
jgi:hypothetical protein